MRQLMWSDLVRTRFVEILGQCRLHSVEDDRYVLFERMRDLAYLGGLLGVLSSQ